jgi:hypothetical protein
MMAKKPKIIDGVIHWYCPGCKAWLPFDNYNHNVNTKNGLQSHCRLCQKGKQWQRDVRVTAAVLTGLKCASCGIYFTEKNEKPSACTDCFKRQDNKYPASKYPEI